MVKIKENSLDLNSLKIINSIYKLAMKTFGQSYNKAYVYLDIITSNDMIELNYITRNKRISTDVLTFPNFENVLIKKITKKNYMLEYNRDYKKVFLGDIVINIDKVKEQAEEYNHPFTRELGYLFIHGLLHILGFDHQDDESKTEMRDLEERILSKLDVVR